MCLDSMIYKHRVFGAFFRELKLWRLYISLHADKINLKLKITCYFNCLEVGGKFTFI